MALEISKVREELASLQDRKASIERKIQGLEHYLGMALSNPNNGKVIRASVRGGVDIRPMVRNIYVESNNQPLKFKELVDRVAQAYPDTERVVIEGKMVHVKRTILEKVGYGKYRLKAN